VARASSPRPSPLQKEGGQGGRGRAPAVLTGRERRLANLKPRTKLHGVLTTTEKLPVPDPVTFKCKVCRLSLTDFETFRDLNLHLAQASITAAVRWCEERRLAISHTALARHRDKHMGPWLARMAERNAIAAALNQAGIPADAMDAGLRSLQTLNVIFTEWLSDLLGTDDASREAARNRRGDPESLKLMEQQSRNAERLMTAEERKERTRLISVQRRLAEIMVDTKVADHLQAAQGVFDQVYDSLSDTSRLEIDRAFEALKAGRRRQRALHA
jgi:hypothetical protein